MEKIVIGIYISQKVIEPIKVQYLLSKYGCSIRTRLGINDTLDEVKGGGIILLELTGDCQECIKLEEELRGIEFLDVQKMTFKV